MGRVRTLKLGTKLTSEDEAVMKEYPCIVLWCKELLSYDYYTIDQCYQAKKDGAPRNAIYKDNNGEWHTVDDILSKDLKEKYTKHWEANK